MSTLPEDALPDARTLFDEAACGLLLTTADGTLRRVNQTFCRWIGRSPQDLVDRHKLQDLLTMGGRIFHQTHWAPLLQMQGAVAEVKLEIVHRDGHALPMVMNAVRRDHAGTSYHELAVFSAEDRHQYEHELLLARRRAEELLAREQLAQQALALSQFQLRLALESARLHVWHVDASDGQRRYENDTARLLGSPGARPVSEAEFAACIHPEDRAREAQALSQAMSPGSGRYHCVYRLNGLDGVQRTIGSSGRAYFHEDGSPMRFVGMLQDITVLSRQREMAEDRALFAEQMIGIVSHDLRNPLAAIQMSAHLLGRGDPTPHQVRVLERLGNSAGRANRMIADLLDFTQARLGQGLKLAARPVDLHRLVADCVSELALSFPGRQLEHGCSGEGECVLDGDRLAQLIGNLVANAMTYGATGTPVHVGSAIGPDSLTISVHNMGPPVPPELMARLFEPMVRGDIKRAGRSVGLGLFIVREIARAHGGGVAVVASSWQEGTRFTATLPRSAPGPA